MPLTRDNFRLSRLVVIGQVFQITPLHQTLLPGEVPQLQQTLSPQVIARIYGELAAIGYASLRQVPGGAQMSSADGSMTLQVTGTGFQFSENLRVTGIVPAIERLERAIESFFNSLSPDTSVAGQTVDLQGVWDNLGQQADEYMNRRFLTAEAPRLVEDLGMTYNGGAIRLSLVRPAVTSLPAGVVVVGGGPSQDAVDVRIEPLYSDKSKLFIQVTGIFTPTRDRAEISRRVEFVRDLTVNRLARNLSMEA